MLHCMLSFQNIFRISVTNRKVGKTDSMVILKTNIAWNIMKFQNFYRVSGFFALISILVVFIKKNWIYFTLNFYNYTLISTSEELGFSESGCCRTSKILQFLTTCIISYIITFLSVLLDCRCELYSVEIYFSNLSRL